MPCRQPTGTASPPSDDAAIRRRSLAARLALLVLYFVSSVGLPVNLPAGESTRDDLWEIVRRPAPRNKLVVINPAEFVWVEANVIAWEIVPSVGGAAPVDPPRVLSASQYAWLAASNVAEADYSAPEPAGTLLAKRGVATRAAVGCRCATGSRAAGTCCCRTRAPGKNMTASCCAPRRTPSAASSAAVVATPQLSKETIRAQAGEDSRNTRRARTASPSWFSSGSQVGKQNPQRPASLPAIPMMQSTCGCGFEVHGHLLICSAPRIAGHVESLPPKPRLDNPVFISSLFWPEVVLEIELPPPRGLSC